MINSNTLTCSNTSTPHTHFSITPGHKWTELSALQTRNYKGNSDLSQQSSAAMLRNVIKTFDMSFNEDKRSISETEISLSFALSQGGQRVHTFREKDNININASPSNMPGQSFLLPPGVVLKTFRLWCVGSLWLRLCFNCKSFFF